MIQIFLPFLMKLLWKKNFLNFIAEVIIQNSKTVACEIFWFWGGTTQKNCWNNSNGNIGDIFEKFWPIYWKFITDVIFLGVWLDIFQWGIQMSFVMVYFWIMNRISMLSDLERIQIMLNEDSHYEWIDADKIQKLKKKLLILPLNKLWIVKSLPTVLTVEWKSPVTYLTLLILILNIKRLR